MQQIAPSQLAKDKAITAAIEQIDKAFGKGTIMRLGEGAVRDVPVISTGCLSLDLALGIGGVPRGRVVEIYGPESSGKTTLTLQLIAQAQKAGGVCAFIDAEHALDTTYAAKLGVDVPALLISQPDCGEQALEITDVLVRSGAIDLLVIDSVAALVPRSELEGEMGDHHVGLHARLMSQALRKLTAAAHRTGTTCVFINQLRMKIGVTFGSPEVTTGGQALKFYSSVRIDIRRIGSVKKGDEIVGNKTKIKVAKNKLAPPFKTVFTEIRFGAGICPYLDLLDNAVELNLITKSGSWHSLGDERLGNGRDAVREVLRTRTELFERLRTQVLQLKGVIPSPKVSDAAPASEARTTKRARERRVVLSPQAALSTRAAPSA